MLTFRVLTINPGSTSTKIAVFENEDRLLSESISHTHDELAQFDTVIDQYDFRKNIILRVLGEKGIDVKTLNAVVGRGGLTKPVEGGTYFVNEAMVRDLKIGVSGQHVTSLGGLIALDIAKDLNIPAYVVDPVVVDEMDGIAKISGMPDIERKSIFHALNQKAGARRYARENNARYEELNLIVAHMGGGISVGAHRMGRVVDINNALDGEGPFSPERSGSLPVGDLIKLCFSGKYTKEQLLKKVTGKGGLVAYLGTNDGLKVSERIKNGDEYAELVFKAMAYQVAKEIGSCTAVLCGRVNAIILTGGIAYNSDFVGWVKDRVEFIAPVVVYPGENEMLSLAEGGLRVLRGEEAAKEYN
jgi:butyrate kinase